MQPSCEQLLIFLYRQWGQPRPQTPQLARSFWRSRHDPPQLDQRRPQCGATAVVHGVDVSRAGRVEAVVELLHLQHAER